MVFVWECGTHDGSCIVREAAMSIGPGMPDDSESVGGGGQHQLVLRLDCCCKYAMEMGCDGCDAVREAATG